MLLGTSVDGGGRGAAGGGGGGGGAGGAGGAIGAIGAIGATGAAGAAGALALGAFLTGTLAIVLSWIVVFLVAVIVSRSAQSLCLTKFVFIKVRVYQSS